MKIQLKTANEFISSIANDEEHIMHWKSGIIETMNNDEADEVIKWLFDSLKNRYQNNFELLKSSAFFSMWVFCHDIHDSQDSRAMGDYLFNFLCT